jgi:DHA3 family multidrug efflux protein-like MFS transporter
MKAFHRLVANTLVAGVTNSFLWFALTFWVYLETRSVIASSVIGGGYMLLLAASALAFGTFVDRHERKTSMLTSTVGTLAAYMLAALVYATAPAGSLQDLSRPMFWAFVALVLGGSIAGNLRAVALSTTVTLLVPEDRHDKANGLVGTVNGVSFAITSVFSGLAIGFLGMGWSLAIAVALIAVAGAHLLSITVPGDRPGAARKEDGDAAIDLRGAARAVRVVPGLLALLFFSTFNNFLMGVFIALTDPYALTLVSVEAWGFLLGIASVGFVVGGITVARRGLGANPVRMLLLTNVGMWTSTILFPVRSSAVALTVGFFVYFALIPRVEASEQTIIQRVVPFSEQGRVFGFAQSLETAAAPITAFLIGPIAQVWVIPLMTDGTGADAIGSWFGTGADRGMALMFIIAGTLGLGVTLLALRSPAYRRLSNAYADVRDAPVIPSGQHDNADDAISSPTGAQDLKSNIARDREPNEPQQV